MQFVITCPPGTRKIRLDTYLSECLEDMSRSRVQSLIRDGLVTVGGMKVKTGYLLAGGETISVSIPEAEPSCILPEDIPLDIVYEDSDIIVVNKPKGMVVHPAAGHTSGTLVNALMYHCGDSLSGINGELRPGIVHRIDKDTTGLIMACKNDASHRSIARQLKEHSTERKYSALCWGNFTKDEGRVDAPIERNRVNRREMAIAREGGGRNAVTGYTVIERFPGTANIMPVTHISCVLETGRTHQIRVHMKYTGHPLLGDETYGIRDDRFRGNGQYLHAGVLGFVHPSTGKRMHFEAPLPDYFLKTIETLRRH